MRKAKSSEDGDAMSMASGATRYYGGGSASIQLTEVCCQVS